MKENYYIIALIAVAVIALLLGALSARLYTNLWEWKAAATDYQAQIENQRKNTRELCLEKLSLSNQLTEAEKRADDLETENKHLNDLLDRALAELETEQEPEPEPGTKNLPLPEGHTNVISGMPYTTITNKRSEQWALQPAAYTGKYGIRCYFDGDHIYFLSAMGSAYGRTIGDTFRVMLNCGTVMYVMLAEFKDDGTDPNFFGHKTTHADGYDVTCVLEFIYDAEHINSKALYAGNFCNIEYFGGLHGDGGDIVKVEYLGRKWEP